MPGMVWRQAAEIDDGARRRAMAEYSKTGAHAGQHGSNECRYRDLQMLRRVCRQPGPESRVFFRGVDAAPAQKMPGSLGKCETIELDRCIQRLHPLLIQRTAERVEQPDDVLSHIDPDQGRSVITGKIG